MTTQKNNTLHLWDGVLEVASEWPDGSKAAKKQNSYCKPMGKFPVKFEGNIAHLLGCPDSCSVGVPTANLFRDNTYSSRFHFKGVTEETDLDSNRSPNNGGRSTYHVNITCNNNDEEWYLRLPTLNYCDVRSDWDGKISIEGIVVGRGRNHHGSFIEAGWVSGVEDGWGSASTNDRHQKIGLTLGRRYLSTNDERVEWNLSELQSAVMKDAVFSRKDVANFNDGPSLIRPPLLLPPWQSSCLSAFNIMSGGKRKREGNKPILPPQVDSPFCLKLQMKDTRWGKIEANTLWKDQCWGCGKILPDEDISNRITIAWDTWSYEEPIDTDVMRGEFCEGKPECISKALPQLIVMSAKFERILEKNGWFISAFSEDGFWDTINQNQELQNKLTEAGWEDHDGTSWHLEARSSDSD